MLSKDRLKKYFTKHGYKVGWIWQIPEGWCVEISKFRDAKRLFASLDAFRECEVRFYPLPLSTFGRLKSRLRHKGITMRQRIRKWIKI